MFKDLHDSDPLARKLGPGRFFAQRRHDAEGEMEPETLAGGASDGGRGAGGRVRRGCRREEELLDGLAGVEALVSMREAGSKLQAVRRDRGYQSLGGKTQTWIGDRCPEEAIWQTSLF